jgi:hypothetical chaperone protein
MTISLGIDFGTSNTVVALADEGGHVEAIRFDHNGDGLDVYASALCFWDERHGSGRRTFVEGGPWAIDQFLEGRHAHRFIQSFKSFAASHSFQETRIFRDRFRFEDLLSAFLRTLVRHASPELRFDAERVVVGRPVRFAGQNPDDALAMERYRTAFGRLGAGHAAYVYEPVGAAFFYTRSLERDSTVLVADFGGGTTDFSVMRFSRQGDHLAAVPLGHAGVGIAGDAFDYRIVDRVVSPHLGKGGRYRSMGKILEVPVRYYGNLARWNQLATMKGTGDLKDLKELARAALDPEPLQRFIDIVEYDLGFALYRSVSAAKIALSAHEEAEFRFNAEGIGIESTIARADFESWISEDVARIESTLDDALIEAGIGADEVDRVFLTGGTSFVPAVRRLFTDRFGAERLVTGHQFASIAYGLALVGRTPDPSRWAVDGGTSGEQPPSASAR